MKDFINKIIIYILVESLVLQPVIVYAADSNIVPAQNYDYRRPHVDISNNGIDILNINTPNAKGLSYNRYNEFEANALILNNHATNINTELAGYIEGNPNLLIGQAAKAWISENIGQNITRLNGQVEVAGQQMDVFFVNENGINCNSCSFINVDRLTLSTGKPAFGAAGGLDHIIVNRGKVTVEGLNGLNASNIGSVDILARAVDIQRG